MGSPSAPNPQSPSDAGQAASRTYFRSERERVLESMLRVAAATGYETTAVADVVKAAAVEPEYFEEMFGDKETCFLEAYDAAIDVAVAFVAAGFESAGGQPWPARVEAGLRALCELFSAEAEIIRMGMVEIAAAGEEARDRYRGALARFAPFLEEGDEYSGRAQELPADTAQFAVGGAASMIFDEVRAGRGRELERILPELVFAVLMPYLGPEAAEDEMRKAAALG